MPPLRHAGPRPAAVREPVALDDGHPLGMPGQHLRREQPRETPTHNNHMPPTPTTARSSGRVHRSTPLVAVVRRHQYPAHQTGLTAFQPFCTPRRRPPTPRLLHGGSLQQRGVDPAAVLAANVRETADCRADPGPMREGLRIGDAWPGSGASAPPCGATAEPPLAVEPLLQVSQQWLQGTLLVQGDSEGFHGRGQFGVPDGRHAWPGERQ